MVTKINLGKDPTLDFLGNVLDSRINNPYSLPEFYRRIKDDLILAYEKYHVVQGNPEKITNLNFRNYVDHDDEVKLRHDTLINLYSTKSDKFITSILNGLRHDHQLIFCPYCGEEVIPSTLDHYLPKEKYPEYSICLDNLVPACTKCQGKDAKGEKVLNLNNSRIFFHPYYENIEEFLILKILPPYDSPSFTLDLKYIKDKDLYEILASHVVELNIYDRFLRFAKSQHINLLKLSKKNRESGSVMNDKIQIYLEEKEIKSKNVWSAIYYRSVLSNSELLDYLNTGALPDFI
ncbi:hypothetical protein [Acinetobacter sp. CWB-B33]|uniref:HNH endonuclease n=1 Tax=Acinetobacter sp. CWB-B33 TaxID=2815724 RepID=UPI0031FEB020